MKKSRRFISLLLSLAVFIAIFLGTNAYQYFAIKNDIASTVIKAVGDTELKKIQAFIQGVEIKLNIVRDWGRSGILESKTVAELNKQFIPLINHEPSVNGLVMGDNDGSEYYLSKQEKGYLVRETRQVNEAAQQRFQLWDDAETPQKKWQEQSDYNPVNRPWFKPVDALNSVYWTKIYQFHQEQKQGVTASVSWKKSESTDDYAVFGIDILLSNVEELLAGMTGDSPVNYFLVNSENSSFLTGERRANRFVAEGSALLHAVLPQCIEQWNKEGRQSRAVTSIQYNGEKWIASLQPLFQQGKTFWVGVVTTESALLSTLNKSLYSIDLVDIVVTIVTGLLLVGYLWKTGVLRTADTSVAAPIVRLLQYINEGEGAKVEFKSSVRMNLKTGSTGKEIEFAWLKAVVGFLNTNGGVLLIGVDDGGRIIGLEADDFENNDRCLLHIKNLIHQHIGAEFASFIQATLVENEDGQVAMLECKAAFEPVFLKVGKTEEFYIRSGPSSTKLSPSQMVSYIQQGRA